MKVRYLPAIVSITLASFGFAQEFTYQGFLRQSGQPANGSYDFEFRLFTSASGNTQVGTLQFLDNVNVQNGLFTVALNLGSIGTLWTGEERWLEIRVRPGNSSDPNDFQTLSPRVKITPTPLSYYALRSSWNGLTDIPAGFADGIDNDTLYFAGAGLQLVGTTFSIANLGVTTGMLADGAVTTPKLADGAVTTAKIGNLQVTDAKIADVAWSKITGAPSAFPPTGSAGGDLSGTYPNPTVAKIQGRSVAATAPNAGQVLKWNGTAWAPADDLTGSGAWQQSGTTVFYTGGNVGIGTSATTARLHVESDSSDTNATLRLHEASTTDSARLEFTNNNTARKWQMRGFISTTATSDRLSFWHQGGQGEIMALRGDGRVAVRVLEITGADLAEKFPITEKVEPGMVVEIDPDNPGHLRLARTAYSKRVAGIVAGANGLNTGVVLGNLPNSESHLPIAMSGRVWVYADATERAIEPGDFLTSSNRPGYAMAVSDLAKAQGAILGKAMTGLKQGETGFVLVLVNLQ